MRIFLPGNQDVQLLAVPIIKFRDSDLSATAGRTADSMTCRLHCATQTAGHSSVPSPSTRCWVRHVITVLRLESAYVLAGQNRMRSYTGLHGPGWYLVAAKRLAPSYPQCIHHHDVRMCFLAAAGFIMMRWLCSVVRPLYCQSHGASPRDRGR
jgi:hypothetical protein